MKEAKANKTRGQPQEKAARARSAPDVESALQRTFAAGLGQTARGDSLGAQQSGNGHLQRSADVTKTPAGGGSDDEEQTRRAMADSSKFQDTTDQDFSRIPTQSIGLQTKSLIQRALSVNAPGDVYEQEADRVAETVMRMPATPAPFAFDDLVGMPSGPEVSALPGISRLQASSDGAFDVTPEIASRVDQMRGGGQALPETERTFFEGRMGHDFSQVRLQTDANAVQASRDLNARAFTFGNTIAFNAGAYQPGTSAGRSLLAHELTHVVQQGAAGVQRKPISNSVNGVQRSVVLAHLQRIQRQPGFDTTIYRKEISEFQRSHSAAEIAARQQELVSTPTEAGIQQRDNSSTLRRCGGGGSSSAPPGPASARSGKLKSGPTYSPNGSITAATSGGRQSASFTFSAEFEDDPSKGIYASCCEVRQYIKWTGVPPRHAGFSPASSYSANTSYEDRDSADKRYGNRTGSHSENIVSNRYLSSTGTPDLANGTKYEGSDAPGIAAGSRAGETWYFIVKVIDVCNGDKVLGSDTVNVVW